MVLFRILKTDSLSANNIYLKGMNKELLDRLNNVPSNWNELTTGAYIDLIQHLNIEDEEDSDIKILSILTGVDEEILDACNYKDMLPFMNRLAFLNAEIPIVKIPYKCKSISEITYDGFVNWMQLQDKPLENMKQLLPIFFDELKDTDITAIPYPIVNQCFFLLTKNCQKYFRRSQLSLNWLVVKMWMKQKVETLFKTFKIKTK